jgi:hypothetical protein
MSWRFSRRRLGRDHARSWDGEAGEGPRVLLESPDGAEAHAVWRILHRHGYETMWCPGPRRDAECTLVETGRCHLVDEADVVLSALDLNEPFCQAVVRSLDTDAASRTPVVVVAPRAAEAQWVDELSSSTVVAGPLRAKALLRSIESAGTQAVSEVTGAGTPT